MRDRPTSAYSQTSSINPTRLAHLIAPPQKEVVDPNKVSVSDLSAALVREYLVSKGYRKTLEAFGTEDSVVHRDTRISSRAELVKLLGIGRIVQANRQSPTPHKSFLEVTVQSLSAKAAKSDKESFNKPANEMEIPGDEGDRLGNGDIVHQDVSRPLSKSPRKTAFGLDNDRTNGKYVDTGERPPILGAFDLSNPKVIQRPDVVSQERPRRPLSAKVQELEINDYDGEGFDSDDSDAVAVTASAWASNRGTAMSPGILQDLHEILFPLKSKTGFGEEWLGKGFVFRTDEVMKYGLTQIKGGPCGLLAALQAFILKYLIFASKNSGDHKSSRLRPSISQCRAALIDSITEILFQASSLTKKAILVVKSNSSTAYGSGPLNNLDLHEFANAATLHDFLEATITQFMANGPKSHGIIQLLFSVILSRGIDNIKQDMDEPENKLMGRHGYCTQEMVNLILLGVATSNVHDNDVNLGGEPGSEKILKGIKKQCQFGQLSLFEHYQNLKVGEHLKSPIYPIWVICSESHYTIAFGVTRHLPASDNPSSSFDLFYYDGLANQMKSD